MSDPLHDLYQSIILDHNKRPRNYGKPGTCTHSAEGYNPLCGDKVTVFLTMEGGRIKKVNFESASCAICKASASIMTELLRDRSLQEMEAICGLVYEWLLADHDKPAALSTNGDLAALAGVRQFPARVKCALLPWETVMKVEY